MYEEAIRLRARRLGAAALLLYAIGVLIIVVGLVVAAGLALSYLPSFPTGMPAAPEVARVIAGIVLMATGLIFFIIFAFYAGFGGRRVVSRVDLSGWDVVVKKLGKLYFIATFLLAIGVIIVPGTSPLYATVIIFLVASLFIMISALLVPHPQRSMAAGILLIIAAVIMIVGRRIGIPALLGQLPGVSQIASIPLTYELFSAIAFMIVGVALIVRGMALHWFIPYIIAGAGGLVYTSGLAYTQFSIVSLLSELTSYLSWLQPLGFIIPRGVTGAAEASFWTFYSTSIAGCSLIGISGILGLIALILSIVFLVKSIFPTAEIERRPPPPSLPPPSPEVRRLNYCPSCGAPVSPEDVYCGNCGRKLR